MKRITTTFFICLLLGITSLHAERDNHTQRTPEKQPEFITGFRYLPPGFECFADMFKYKVIDFPGFSTQDTLYFKKYTRPIKGYTVREIHALNGNRCNAYVLCFEKGNKKFFVGGKGCGYAEICTKDRTHRVDSMDYWGVPGRNTITPHSFKYLKEEELEKNFVVRKAENIAPYPWNLENAPITIKTKGRILPSWKMFKGSAGPVNFFMPYGCTTLRITEFPVR